MKLLRINNISDVYIRQFYKTNPDLKNLSFIKQRDKLYHDMNGASDSWSNALNLIGYDAHDISANVEHIQKTWAKENCTNFNDKNWMFEIIKAQISKLKPDVLFLADYITFDQGWVSEIKNSCPSIKLIIGWCGGPYSSVKVFKAYDLVLTCSQGYAENFKDIGFKSFHIDHAFDSRILDRIDTNSEQDIDVSFIGGIERMENFHISREEILLELLNEVGIEIFTPSFFTSQVDELKTILKKLLFYFMSLMKIFRFSKSSLNHLPYIGEAANWNSVPMMPVHSELKNILLSPVYGLEKFQIIHDSLITFNSHIDVARNFAGNMRMFEATGVGSCLLTDWKSNIRDLFEPDVEIVTYKSKEECVDKARWLLNNPKERMNIAKAGQKRCLKDHSFLKRAESLDEIIKNVLQ